MAFLIALVNNRLFLWIAGGGAVVASLFLALQLGVAHGTIKGLNRDIVTTNDAWNKCRNDLAKSDAEAIGFRGQIDGFKSDVELWKDKAAKAQADADRRVAAARRQAQDYRKQGREIRDAKTEGDACVWAERFHIKTLSEERQ